MPMFKIKDQSGNWIPVPVVGSSGTVDQSYDPTSPNAQSGVAVAEGIAEKSEKEIKSYANKTFANAIELQRTGRVVTLNNCSPIDANAKIKLESKNLVSYVPDLTPLTEIGLTVTDNGDGTWFISGQTSDYVELTMFDDVEVEVGETYICNIKMEGPTYPQLSYVNATGYIGNTCVPFVAKASKIKCTAIFGESYPYENYLFAPQVEKGSVITPFTPYVKPEDTKLLKPSKNLLHFEPHTETIEGLTVTYGAGGIVSFNGKLPDEYGNSEWRPFYPVATFEIPLDKNANYVIKPVLEGEYSSEIHVMVLDSKGNESFRWYKGYGGYMEISNEEKITLLICPITYEEYTNETCQIQVEAGVIPTDFEKGTIKEYTPDANGVIEGVEHTPNMTLIASEGAIMQVKYNADIKKYIDEKIAEISAQIV